MNARITIGSTLKPIVNVTEVRIISSWRNLTDTASVKLPRNLRLADKGIHELVSVGESIRVELGYDGIYYTEFNGFVSEVKAGIPVEILAEDQQWKLKQTNISASWKSVSLRELLSEIIPPEFSTKSIDLELGGYRINNSTATKVLAKLKESHGLVAFFNRQTLIVGFPYDGSSSRHKLDFQKNVAKVNLNYETEKKEITVRAISILGDNSRIEIVVGNQGGNSTTLHFYGITDKKELRKMALATLGDMKRHGYKGSITTFGFPFIRSTDIVDLTDGLYPERAGSYFIEKINTSYGKGGFKRRLNLGKKA